MKNRIIILLLIPILLFICSCKKSPTLDKSIKLNEVYSIEVGESETLIVSLRSLNGVIEYTSSDNSIISVNSSGVIVGIKEGTATISASISDNETVYSDSIEVIVKKSTIVVPPHKHIACSECGKCTDENCDGTEDDKCNGHEVIVPPHTHTACSECGKCTDENCDGTEDDKCSGHEVIVPPHTHTECSECGKCTDENCDGTEDDKCGGHEVVEPPHSCDDYKTDWTTVGDKICGTNILQQITCTKCGNVLEERTVSINHEYKSEVIQVKTCVQNGETKYTCINCNHYYIEKDYSTGHVQDDIKIILESTTNTLGTKQIKCKNCDYIYKEFNYVDNGYHKNGKLSVVGSDLVNQYGEKYQLYGLSTHGIQWFSKVVNFDTICAIQENFGNNIIRFAMYTDEDGYCDGSEATKKKMLEALHRGIEIATDLGLYVIVDWHMVGAENILDKNPLTYLEEAKEFFSYISEYYKDQDNILYEIMNEPNGSTTWSDCKKYANEIIPIIRQNTDAIILVGNPKWTADLNSVMNDPLVGYYNIMYTYHFYAADHSNTSQVVKAYDSGFPVFISEFGFMESSGDGSISRTNGDKWKKVLDTRNISYVAWNISNSKGSASIFKYNTSNLSDVSDSNLKEWGIYLKNWYRAKSLNLEEDQEEELNPTVELMMEVPEWSSSYECFIISSNDSESRLDYDWSSSNEAILTVSSYSTITIVGNGTCSIICKNKTTGEVGILDIIVENGSIKEWNSRYKE